MAGGGDWRLKTKKPARAKDQLRDLGVAPSKQRGQNFIIEPTVLTQIVEFGAPQRGEQLVEIGPGLGALTERLLAVDPALTVIEIEEQFCRDLKERFPAIRAERADVRGFDFSTLGRELVVFGNLPYSFSTEIIFHLLEHGSVIKRAVLMLQREFAERVAAKPGGREYGAISVNAQLRADLRLGPVISGDCFHPKARVESILMEMRLLKEPRFEVSDLAWFRKVVQASFQLRRKKLKNSLAASGIFKGEQHIVEVLAAAQISPDIRAERLTLEEFARIAKCGLMNF